MSRARDTSRRRENSSKRFGLVMSARYSPVWSDVSWSGVGPAVEVAAVLGAVCDMSPPSDIAVGAALLPCVDRVTVVGPMSIVRLLENVVANGAPSMNPLALTVGTIRTEIESPFTPVSAALAATISRICGMSTATSDEKLCPVNGVVAWSWIVRRHDTGPSTTRSIE